MKSCWSLLAALMLLPAVLCSADPGTQTDPDVGNPADFWLTEGEALWHLPAGSAHLALDHCDLGLGPGVIRGAYARLPRWFADANQVMDLEQRLAWCMVKLQGLSEEEAKTQPFGQGARHARMEQLSAFIAAASRGLAVDPGAQLPAEQELLGFGARLFHYRAGSHDLACASCHSGDGQRIRLQTLANLDRPEQARQVWTTWPAYRGSQSQLRTMQHRIRDCLRQQRFPEPVYGAPAITALELYLADRARGGLMAAPGWKR